jgi:hypothetical protein
VAVETAVALAPVAVAHILLLVLTRQQTREAVAVAEHRLPEVKADQE